MKQDKPIIQADKISLKYRVRTEDRHTLKWALLSLLKQKERRREFWALNNLNLSIYRGETCGIIGTNGSGKSTLLKLMTGILKPDRGTLMIDGTVSALLELGAGFQPDLTGLENIFLNGSLLGFSRSTIEKRVDEIIDFSGIGQFIDTPVKYYSSGMYMRLGFAIAVHVDPDILLIDEIFAVGDLNFQEKCMDRINRFRDQNKTIILVSHDMNAIRSLCNRAIWLNKGSIGKDGPTTQVIDYYKNFLRDQNEETLSLGPSAQRWGTGSIEITEVVLINPKGKKTTTFQSGGPFKCVIKFQARKEIEKPVFGIALHRNDGVHISGPNTKLNGLTIDSIQGNGEIQYSLDRIPLLPGAYQLSAVVYDDSCTIPYDHQERMHPFTVVEGDNTEVFGLIELNGQWTFNEEETR